jgi:pentatricopeptide repeat protein
MCVKFGQWEQATGFFQQMKRERMTPNTFSFVLVLKACTKLQILQESKHIHTQIL